MDRKFMFLVLVFVFVFGAFITTVILDEIPSIRAIAKKPPAQFLIFSVPVSVKIGESCDISVVVNDEENKAVAEATVCPITTLGTVSPACEQTDATGIASFKLSSTTAGIAEVSANVNGSIPISKSVTCQFL